MQVKDLQLKRALRTALLVLLLGAAGIVKGYADYYGVIIGDLRYELYTTSQTASVRDHVNGTSATGELFIPESVTYAGVSYSVTKIGRYAFYDCSGLVSISIPETVISIYRSSFEGTGWWNNQPDGILYLDGCCLGYKSTKPTGTLQIAEGTRVIAGSAFDDCSGFTGSLTIPNSVTTIGYSAFAGCSGFMGSLTIPNSVTLIDDCAFLYCEGLTGSLTIPNSVTTIGSQAFYFCSGFTSLNLGNSVTTVGGSAFCGCTGFSGILTFPSSVTTVGGSAFEQCNFTAVNYTGDLAQWCNISFLGIFNTNPLESAHNLYINGSLVTELVVPESVTVIKDYTFMGGSCFTGTLTIPSTVTTIGIGAFQGCSGFTGELVIPSSVTSISVITNEGGWENEIGEYDQTGAFQGCSGIISISIPNSVTSIGTNAFNWTGWYANQPDGIIYLDGCCLGYKGWSQPPGNLQIAEGTRLIANGAFPLFGDYWTGNLTLPESLVIIGSTAFAGCKFTGSLNIPNAVATIGNSAFSDCNGFTEAILFRATPPILGNNVFGNDLFYGYNFPIYVPFESLNDYKTANNWSYYESRIYPMSYKTIPGYAGGNNNWQFIASPLISENLTPTSSRIENMVTETTYDLYRFNQSAELEWQNYKAHTNDFTIANGQGYLYANQEDVNLIFKGTFNENSTKTINLIYEAGEPLAGWNLVGNPFPVAATVIESSYYVMNEEGTGLDPIPVSAGGTIPACIGIMVHATVLGQPVTFTTNSREVFNNNNGLLQIVVSNANTRSNAAEDKAVVSFNEGDDLGKFYFGHSNANIYFPKGAEEFAIACAERVGEMPLNFKASCNGQYILSVNPEHVGMDYLHLIDNMTGADIDLLASPSYTFNAKTTDYVSRFRLVFSASGDADGDNANAPFAYIHNEEIVITADAGDAGTASLQVVDILGHICRDAMIASPNHRISTAGMTPGVYVLRLICGDNVKTQKIVIN